MIDDSGSMLLTQDGGVAARIEGSTDIYLFTYGLDYRAALDAFYEVSGRTPLIPRWALGNWWSRYCESKLLSILTCRCVHGRGIPSTHGQIQGRTYTAICRRLGY